MVETDSFDLFKSRLAADLGVAPNAISDAAANAAIDDPILLHHVVTCKSDEFMRSLVLNEVRMRAKSYESLPASTLFRNAAAAAIKWLAAGAKFVSEETYAHRLAICGRCEHRVPAPPGKLYSILGTVFVCDLCGCDVSKKARLSTEICPDTGVSVSGRWI